ncbi:MAG: beta-glucosidase [Spirochaetales bacterium]|nr:beta-glucosidase [Spirochaetales bacterium]
MLNTNKYKKKLAVFISLLVLFSSSCSADPETRSDTVSGYISKLSLTDKMIILTGPGNYKPAGVGNLVYGIAGYINGVDNKELKLPVVKLADGPAGIRINSENYKTSSWPSATLMASTWDLDLIEEVGTAMGAEAKKLGIDIILAPGMNIQRNPLIGRNFEYYSEDPLLTGKAGAAFVRGIQSNGIGATVKHFFGNESETNRKFLNVISDPRTLREIYLRGFQIAVKESSPWSVMSSYNFVNSVYANQRSDALTDILRGEWGFEGFVMSDWYAGNVFSDQDAAARMIKAGTDLIMPGMVLPQLSSSVEKGLLTEDDINRSVDRILGRIVQSPSYKDYKPSGKLSFEDNAKLIRRAGAEGMVLLKNDKSALPISSGSKVALFGVAQIATYKGGTGSGNVLSPYMVNMADGLSSEFELDNELKQFYIDYFNKNKISRKDSFVPVLIEQADEVSVDSDADFAFLLNNAAESNSSAIITISRMAGEGGDRVASAGDYYLSERELELIKAVSSKFHSQNKKVIVVLNVDSVVDTAQWVEYADAILLSYFGGQETGNQVADIISGKVNPSGKLAQSFPLKYEDVPNSGTFPGFDINKDGKPDFILNNEGIYVGYRYYSSFGQEVSFPFGFGLSYTNFSVENPKIKTNTLSKSNDSTIVFQADVKNTGTVSGKEVLQVYVQAPEKVLEKPFIELKAFKKTKLLSPGENQVLSFSIDADELASFDPNRNSWIIEAGEYKVYISNSSDVKNIQQLSFSIKKEIVVAECSDSLALPEGVTVSDVVNITKKR